MGLGAYSLHSLQEVRELAAACRKQRWQGLDPLAERRKVKAAACQERKLTSKPFRWCAEQYIASREDGWSSDKHRLDWEFSLRRFAYPVIGELPVSAIGTEEVLAVLQPHWASRTETASRVRARIENVLDWARIQQYRGRANPARWTGPLEHLL